ncbi:hypothetical protein HB900_14580 [Listeria booriae]|uniref:hypothetical protein n=1 Tax=Listeria booriae TaxID=1552123 RepID=UPI001629A943|nr:hypothetical protein [Listeria booriae]MBC1575694.1 hypothetical protein [Listeria booriae]
MGDGERIYINPIELEQILIELKALCESVELNEKIQKANDIIKESKGETASAINNNITTLKDISDKMQTLFDSTYTFLSNAKESYVSTDIEAGNQFYQIGEGEG